MQATQSLNPIARVLLRDFGRQDIGAAIRYARRIALGAEASGNARMASDYAEAAEQLAALAPDNHANDCAMRFISSAECTCGKLDAPE